MTTTHSLTEPGETIGLLLQELQGATPAAELLRQSLKIPKTYDSAAIWAESSEKPAVIAAFDRINENLPTSDYAARARRRYSINPDALGAGFTNSMLTSMRVVDDGRKTASATLQWLDLGDTTAGATEITALDVTRRKMTINAAGLYSFTTSFCLGFYPLTNMDTTFEDQTPQFLDTTQKGVGIRVYLEVWQGNTMEYTLTLVDGMLSRMDFSERRKRFFGGSVEIALTAGSVVKLVMQRDNRIGRYAKTVAGNPTPVYSPEGIGFSKFIPVDAYNQLRDTQNWVEITRLA